MRHLKIQRIHVSFRAFSARLEGCVTAWGGRAPRWHSRGQRFDPAYLHQETWNESSGSFFCCASTIPTFPRFHARQRFARKCLSCISWKRWNRGADVKRHRAAPFPGRPGLGCVLQFRSFSPATSSPESRAYPARLRGCSFCAPPACRSSAG